MSRNSQGGSYVVHVAGKMILVLVPADVQPLSTHRALIQCPGGTDSVSRIAGCETKAGTEVRIRGEPGGQRSPQVRTSSL